MLTRIGSQEADRGKREVGMAKKQSNLRVMQVEQQIDEQRRTMLCSYRGTVFGHDGGVERVESSGFTGFNYTIR